MLRKVDSERDLDQDVGDLTEMEKDAARDERGAPPPEPPAAKGPLGPRRDRVFPSLPADREAAQTAVAEPEVVSAVAFPFIRNVFTMADLPWGVSKAGFLSSALVAPSPSAEEVLSSLDQPERERVSLVAADFVANHVRTVAQDSYIKTPHQHFRVGTIVVSEDQVPESRLRHAKFQWAITGGRVAELRDVRLPVGHLAPLARPVRTDFGSSCHGDGNDLAYFLAVLLDLLGADAPEPLGAIGAITSGTNSVAAMTAVEPYLAAADADQMHDLVLPAGNGKMNAANNGVRYWSVRDTDEAAFSALTALSGEVVVPNLVRRALTKRAYSWLSLTFAWLALMAWQASSWLGLRPPITFMRYLLAVLVLCVIGSVVFTHRFWRLDR
jgi:hypothetical protein